MARGKIDKGVTLIAANSELEGNVRFQDQLYLSGKVIGNLVAEQESASVVISEEGILEGEIHVANVVINGRVTGDVYASSRLELAKNARVSGNVHYKLLEMHLGARVDGQLVHEEFAEAPASSTAGCLSPTKCRRASAAREPCGASSSTVLSPT